MSAELSLSEVITEALARPLKAECSWCHTIYRDGPVDANGLHSHGICPGCEERILTKRAQDRAYRLYVDAARVWVEMSAGPDSEEFFGLVGTLLSLAQQGGGLDEDADNFIRFQMNIPEAQ